ncbi:MAG: undecaprenyl/decaprenyl-phosphate alpha-N-acetylglucosaminyl 1-phosphate transferase [Treponema sp.]|nr:undecaprenyl/decaprenyl-phosphate alpha-N-acetylglucosaminyl 1-phosphate transferase [Candidatus Treponema equi]
MNIGKQALFTGGFISASFLISTVVTFLVIKLCKKKAWYDSVNERKVHTGLVPRLGGIGFVPVAMVLAVICNLLTGSFNITNQPAVCSALAIFIFGVLDDFVDLKADIKLMVQVVAALVVMGFNFMYINAILAIISFFWIIGIVNSYNLIDGIDGLCGTLSLMACCTFGLYYWNLDTDIATTCFVLCGSIAGFLVFNAKNAKIFMGDGGSQFLGFFIATLALFQFRYGFTVEKCLIALNIVSIPMIDCVASIWRRLREHRAIMSPDKRHLHHKIMSLGFNATQTLLILISVQALVCGVCIVSWHLETITANILLGSCYAIMIILFSVVHYISRAKD